MPNLNKNWTAKKAVRFPDTTLIHTLKKQKLHLKDVMNQEALRRLTSAKLAQIKGIALTGRRLLGAVTWKARPDLPVTY